VITGNATLTALRATIGRPAWWILALAGFLVRGGIVLFLVAIVSLPSPLALSNILGPLVTPLYLGRLEPATAALIALGIATILGWLIAGSWLGAATEVALIRDVRRTIARSGPAVRQAVAADPDGFTGRVLAARALALLPLALTLGIGSVRIFDVTYRELVNPSSAGSIVLRVIIGAAGPVAAIIVAWLLGEIVGGVAARRIVLNGESVRAAVGRAAIDLVRRPGGTVISALSTTILLALDLIATLAVVGGAWTEARSQLVAPHLDLLLTGLALLALGAAWCLALLMTGLVDAWRGAAMTLETERAVAAVEPKAAGSQPNGLPVDPAGGTIGASSGHRPGDWSDGHPGGSL